MVTVVLGIEGRSSAVREVHKQFRVIYNVRNSRPQQLLAALVCCIRTCSSTADSMSGYRRLVDI